MPNKFLLEIAAFTLQGALDAAKAGAHRIELCDNAADGGTTPSYGMLIQAKQKIKIPVFPIIRPRGGNFVYSKTEFDCIKEDVLICKKLHFEGIVVGFLDEKGNVDTKKLKEIVKLAKPMQVTFHRAFDRTKKPLNALEDIIACGCDRILTSGQYPSVLDGIENVRLLIEKARVRIIIMPGSGLNSNNVQEIAVKTNAVEFHTAARKIIQDPKIVSPKTMNEKLSFTSVDKKEIRKILKELEGIEMSK
jgi:copper homeostasis protein